MGEHTSDPKSPPNAPQITRGTTTCCHCTRQAELSSKSDAANVTPMMMPPAAEAAVPVRETPPFVPGGTTLNVVISRGGVFERIPSSEASVSPRQHAKWLFGNNVMRGVDGPWDQVKRKYLEDSPECKVDRLSTPSIPNQRRYRTPLRRVVEGTATRGAQ